MAKQLYRADCVLQGKNCLDVSISHGDRSFTDVRELYDFCVAGNGGRISGNVDQVVVDGFDLVNCVYRVKPADGDVGDGVDPEEFFEYLESSLLVKVAGEVDGPPGDGSEQRTTASECGVHWGVVGEDDQEASDEAVDHLGAEGSHGAVNGGDLHGVTYRFGVWRRNDHSWGGNGYWRLPRCAA